MRWLDFGERGLDYVRDALLVAATLGKDVLQLQEVSSGRVTAPVPAGFEPGSLADIGHALEWGEEWERCHASFLDRIFERIAEPGGWIVFEDRHTKATEAVPVASGAPEFFLAGSEVHYFAVEDSTRETIEAVLRWASPWRTRGYVGTGGMARDVGRGDLVESHDIRSTCSEHTGDRRRRIRRGGYLWWEKP